MTEGSPVGRELFRRRDRWGRELTLETATWTGHVVTKRARLLGREESVRATLTAPDEVRDDVLHDDRESFSRRGALPAPLNHLLPKGVVEFSSGAGSAETIGWVVTAFPAHQTKPAERRKWP